MIDKELYTYICHAKIKDSICLASKILLKDTGKNFDILQDTFIAVVSYIGTFINLINIKLWLNCIENLVDVIDNDKIVIKDIYVVIAKLCLLCDIYIKNPTIKTGAISVKILREKIIDMFSDDSFKLTMNGMSKFEGIIPPTDSPSYNLAQQIITGYVHSLKKVNELSSDDKDKISDIAAKMKNSFDYIIRKKYTFETKFYESDNDAVWFLWGIVSLLFNDTELDLLYQLFCFDYNKKNKNHRVGILCGTSLVMVYLTKKDVARNWNQSEVRAIQKIEEVSLILYNDIRKELKETGQIEVTETKTGMNGIDYIATYKPCESNEINKTTHEKEALDIPVTKSIKYRRQYM